jgi:outer membrane protein assembly factor BamA
MYDLLRPFCFYTLNRLPWSVITFACFLVASVWSFPMAGQKKKHLQLLYLPGNQIVQVGMVDTFLVKNRVAEALSDALVAGYTAASVDSLHCKADSCTGTIFKGEKYRIRTITMTEEQQALLESSGVRLNKIESKPFDSTTVRYLLNAAVEAMVNNGYPFGNAMLAAARFSGNDFSATLITEKGPFIVFDTIFCKGRATFPPWFLYRLLQVRKGAPYTHNILALAEQRTGELPYCTQTQRPTIRFHDSRADLVLHLDKKRANRFDFLIGFLPQARNAASSLVLTGDFLAETHNLLNYGEYTFMQVKRINAGMVEMAIKSTVPYLGNLPVGSHVDFRMFKNKSLTLDLHLDAGFQFYVFRATQLKIFGSYRSSSLIQIDLETIAQSGTLPARLDTRYSGLGTSIQNSHLDYRFNPYRGFQLDASLNLGARKILPNRQIIDLAGFGASYDTINTSTFQAEILGNGSWYIPLGKRLTLKTGFQAALKYTATGLLTNELRRLGGNKTLRGFDEESLFTDKYLIGTAELRLLLDQNSYLSFPFVDAGIVHLPGKDGGSSLFVTGLGLGLNFGTPAGVFNLAFAAGNSRDLPISLANTKIHFGYVNLF